MNRTVCPECLSTDVRPVNTRENLIDCHACGIWWEPAHPQNHPDSPCFGKQCDGKDPCYGTCLNRTTCEQGASTGRWEIRAVTAIHHQGDCGPEDQVWPDGAWEEVNEIINPKGETCAYIHDDTLAQQFCAWANMMTHMTKETP